MMMLYKESVQFSSVQAHVEMITVSVSVKHNQISDSALSPPALDPMLISCRILSVNMLQVAVLYQRPIMKYYLPHVNILVNSM